MIGNQRTGALPGLVISSAPHEGLRILTADGQPMQLAVIGPDGAVHAAGPDVAREVEAVAVQAYRHLLQGQGHLRVLSAPESQLCSSTPS